MSPSPAGPELEVPPNSTATVEGRKAMELVKLHPLSGVAARGPGGIVDRRLGLLLVALSALVWGSLGVTTKQVFNVAATNAYSVTLLRALVALSASLVICVLVLGKATFRITRSDLGI